MATDASFFAKVLRVMKTYIYTKFITSFMFSD